MRILLLQPKVHVFRGYWIILRLLNQCRSISRDLAYGLSLMRSTARSTKHSLPVSSPKHFAQKDVHTVQWNGNSVRNRVLVGEDATKEPSEVCLVWALENFIKAGDSVTVIGILHEITTPMGYKAQANLSDFVGTNRLALEAEVSQKLARFEDKFRQIAEYCDTQGVHLDISIAAGTPLKAVLVREAVKLKATHVLLDRNLRRDRKYYKEHLECNVVTFSPKNQVEYIRESSFFHMLDVSGLPPELNSPASTTPSSPFTNATLSTFDRSSISTSDTSNQYRVSQASLKSLRSISEGSSCMGAHGEDSVDGSESCQSVSSSASDCSFIDLFILNTPDGVMSIWSRCKWNGVDNASGHCSSADQAALKAEIISPTNPVDLESAASSSSALWLQKNAFCVHPERGSPKLNDFITGANADTTSDAVNKLGESHLSDAQEVQQTVQSENLALDLHSDVRENWSLDKSIAEMEKTDVVWCKTLPQAPQLCAICKFTSMELGRSAKVYDWLELQVASSHFATDNLISEGGFSFVYKGILPEGQIVAIKKLKSSSLDGDAQLSTEVEALSCAQHRNLVRLLGYGVKDGDCALVYEYVCNGSLDQHLSGKSGVMLEWSSRYKIALGAARGLRYLHEECRVGCIVHHDMTAKNILLTHDFVPLVGDFGLAKLKAKLDATVKREVLGAQSFHAPEYIESGKATPKTDVYSFGVVLLELITGRRAIDLPGLEGDVSLMEWARSKIKQHGFHELVDEKIALSVNAFELTRMVKAASACIKNDPQSRPAISQVIRILEGGLYGSSPESLDEMFPVTNSTTLACNSVATGGRVTNA